MAGRKRKANRAPGRAEVAPPGGSHAPSAEETAELEATRALLASVEELRALLAPLSEEDRRRVLQLARTLAGPPHDAP